jgi:hypothetical protein
MPAAAIWFSGGRYAVGLPPIIAGARYLGLLQFILSIRKVFAPKPKYLAPGHIIGSYRPEENQMATAGKSVDYIVTGGDLSFSY